MKLTVEVQERNAKYYDQQEDMLYSQAQDRRAESEARIRECRNKEAEAPKQARQASDPVKSSKHKHEARRWGQKADVGGNMRGRLVNDSGKKRLRF